jgi:CO/xanthine dehydrogenase Mo-binding subunit
VVGKSFPRIDIPEKVAATYTYIQNVRVPGMLHARVVQPRGAGANTSANDQPVSVDAKSISHIPGAQVVQIGNWLSVVAPTEYDAIQAAEGDVEERSESPGSSNFWS